MSQRISLPFFVVLYTFMVRGWNAEFYRLKERDAIAADQFGKMLFFCLFAFGVELVSSTVNAVVIK
jgi:hypothetical protein